MILYWEWHLGWNNKLYYSDLWMRTHSCMNNYIILYYAFRSVSYHMVYPKLSCETFLLCEPLLLRRKKDASWIIIVLMIMILSGEWEMRTLWGFDEALWELSYVYKIGCLASQNYWVLEMWVVVCAPCLYLGFDKWLIQMQSTILESGCNLIGVNYYKKIISIFVKWYYVQ